MKLSIVTATHKRSELLISRALASLQQQTTYNFEWVVINDGGDENTRIAIEQSQSTVPFPIYYQEIPHNGFGLGKARNLGITVSSGELIAYLDDDNMVYPHFAERIQQAFMTQADMKYCLPIQERRRNIVRNENLLKEGVPFLSIVPENSLNDFINPRRALFDSNGFTHVKADSPTWSEELHIYIDYEFFLKCASIWGLDRGSIIREILIEYIQTNEGEVGRSSYEEWARELSEIHTHRDQYKVLQSPLAVEGVVSSIRHYEELAKNRQSIEAFGTNQQSRL